MRNVGSKDWMPDWATGMRIDDVTPAFDVFTLGESLLAGWSRAEPGKSQGKAAIAVPRVSGLTAGRRLTVTCRLAAGAPRRDGGTTFSNGIAQTSGARSKRQMLKPDDRSDNSPVVSLVSAVGGPMNSRMDAGYAAGLEAVQTNDSARQGQRVGRRRHHRSAKGQDAFRKTNPPLGVPKR
jgi:hypothetical protein